MCTAPRLSRHLCRGYREMASVKYNQNSRRTSITFILLRLSSSTSLLILLLILNLSYSLTTPTRRRFNHRRKFLGEIVATLFTTAALSASPQPVQARNLPEVYSSSSQSGSLETLKPIIEMKAKLIYLFSLPRNEQSIKSTDFQAIVASFPNTEASFKALFDAYSDPVSYKQKFLDQNAFLVYYTKGFDGPGRPSLESNLPIRQSLQYGTRNEAWTAFDEFLNEYRYYLSNHGEDSTPEVIFSLLGKAIASLDAYISLAPEKATGKTGE